MKTPKRLREQILFFTLTAFLICTFLVGAAFYCVSTLIVRQNRIRSTISAIKYTAHQTEQELSQISDLMDYLFVDKQIQSALELPVQTAYERTLQWNALNSAFNRYERLNLYHSINCVILYNQEGYAHTFRYMALDTSPYLRRNQELGWTKAALENQGRLLWSTDISKTASAYQPYEQKIPCDLSVIRALRTTGYKQVAGAVYLSLQPSFLSAFQKNNGLDHMRIWLLDPSGRSLNSKADETEIREIETMFQNRSAKIHSSGSCRYLISGTTVYYEHMLRQEGFHLFVAETIPNGFSTDRSILLLGFLILLVFIFLAGSIWIFLTRAVIRPIQTLSSTMHLVDAKGVRVRAETSTQNEIGSLSNALNDMLERIEQLMNEKVKTERAVKEAEHKAALAQINPHFVYNALFAIRMMAVLQKADNIQKMVDALWRMLKNSTARDNQPFTLRDEIQNVNDYVYILQTMNGKKFELVYEISDALMPVSCPKFIIQPIVENAVMHGILPKQSFSQIRISACEKDGDVLIRVSNNGIPIPTERMKELAAALHDPELLQKDVGLVGIGRRLRLQYGSSYGVWLDSSAERNETIVTLRFPCRKEEPHV